MYCQPTFERVSRIHNGEMRILSTNSFGKLDIHIEDWSHPIFNNFSMTMSSIFSNEKLNNYNQEMDLILLNVFYIPSTFYMSFPLILSLVYDISLLTPFNKRRNWGSQRWSDLSTLVSSISKMGNFAQLQNITKLSIYKGHYLKG